MTGWTPRCGRSGSTRGASPRTPGLLRALLAGGNRAAAIAHFRRFAAQMREELGLSPSRDLLEVVGEILPARPARRA